MIPALGPFNLSRNHDNENKSGSNTHGDGEQVKIPLLPNNIGKNSVNDAEAQQSRSNT